MLIDRAEIAGMIPHAGAMQLLDGVLSWDAARITCLSRTHRDERNPLRSAGQLSAVCGIEYAAQAMAIHGSLTGNVGEKPRAGYMASVRDVSCRRDRLDDLEGDLVVAAEKLMGEESHAIYAFEIEVGEVKVLRGRVAVVLDAARAKT